MKPTSGLFLPKTFKLLMNLTIRNNIINPECGTFYRWLVWIPQKSQCHKKSSWGVTILDSNKQTPYAICRLDWILDFLKNVMKDIWGTIWKFLVGNVY